MGGKVPPEKNEQAAASRGTHTNRAERERARGGEGAKKEEAESASDTHEKGRHTRRGTPFEPPRRAAPVKKRLPICEKGPCVS